MLWHYRPKIAHYGCFEDISAVIDMCPFCSVSHAAYLSFKVDFLFSGLSVLWEQRTITCPLFFNQKIAVMHWSEPKSYNNPFVLLHSQDFGFRGYWSGYRNPFSQSRLLTVTLQPCSLLFNVQVMILAGSSRFFNLASTSVDGCYLYIMIHYGMSQRDWGIRLVSRDGRPDPYLLKQ